MAKTYRERLIAGLIAAGYSEDLDNKSKYTAFHRSGFNGRLFVGKNGALRSGDCATRSHSVGDANNQTGVYREILKRGDAELYIASHAPNSY